MFRFIEFAKDRLSHVSETTWHYKLVKEIWGGKTQGKSCTYYWFKFPLALVTAGFLWALFLLFLSIGWFLGFSIANPDDSDSYYSGWYGKNHAYYPYLHNSKGEKRWFAPWYVATAMLFVALIGYISFINQSAGNEVLWGLAITCLGIVALALIGFIGFVFYKTFRSNIPVGKAIFKPVGRWFERNCPPLVVVPKPETEETAAKS